MLVHLSVDSPTLLLAQFYLKWVVATFIRVHQLCLSLVAPAVLGAEQLPLPSGEPRFSNRYLLERIVGWAMRGCLAVRMCLVWCFLDRILLVSDDGEDIMTGAVKQPEGFAHSET